MEKREPSVTWYPVESNAVDAMAGWVKERSWVGLDYDEKQPGDEPPVMMALSRRPDGRLVCTGLIVGELAPWYGEVPAEITARSLRQIRIPELIEYARSSNRTDDTGWNDAVTSLLDSAPLVKPEVRKRTLDDAHFRSVADAYRAAMATTPSAPVSWLAKEWSVSEPTLRRWLQRARDRGFLGPSTPGRAGEGAPVKKRGKR